MAGQEVYSPSRCREILNEIKSDPRRFVERCKQNPNIRMYEVYRGLKAWGITTESSQA